MKWKKYYTLHCIHTNSETTIDSISKSFITHNETKLSLYFMYLWNCKNKTTRGIMKYLRRVKWLDYVQGAINNPRWQLGVMWTRLEDGWPCLGCQLRCSSPFPFYGLKPSKLFFNLHSLKSNIWSELGWRTITKMSFINLRICVCKCIVKRAIWNVF